MKSLVRGFLAAAVLAAVLSGARVASADRVIIRVEPPAPRHEVIITRPGRDHVWVPGYWSWDGGAYVWVGGSWQLPPRRHARWVPGRYRHFRHGGWEWIPGHWR